MGAGVTFDRPVQLAGTQGGLSSSQAFRYDSSSCPTNDCSIPFLFPNPKDISNAVNNPVFRTTVSPMNPRKVNQMQLGMAAYVNHDVGRHIFNTTFTGTQRLQWPMSIDPWDPLTQIFDPRRQGANLTTVVETSPTYEWGGSVSNLTLTINRVGGAPGTGPGTGNPKNSMSGGTPWLDLDSFYGTPTQSNFAINNSSFVGRINTTNGHFILDVYGLPLSAGGAALSPAAMLMEYLLGKEHNWYVDQLTAEFASRTPPVNVSGIKMFYLARRWVIAVWQAMIMYEYAPILFYGPSSGNILKTYPGPWGPMPPYQPRNLTNEQGWSSPVEVSAIAHYAYSAYGSSFQALDANWELLEDFPMRMAAQGISTVLDPTKTDPVKQPRNTLYIWTKYGPEALARGLIKQPQEAIDLYFPDCLRTGSPQSPDIMARQIARQRDIGVPTWNDARTAWGLDRYTNFSQFAYLSPAAQQILAKVYNNSIDLVDFYVGGFADYDPNFHMSPFWAIIYQQYWTDLRDFDPWWFEGSNAGFTKAEITQLQSTKLSTLLLKHTSIGAVPCSAMYSAAPDCPSAPQTACPTANANSALLGGVVGVSWLNTTTANPNTVQFTVTGSTTGFIALGFPSTPGQMLGSTAFISRFWSSSNITTQQYFLGARQPCANGVGVCPVTNGNYTIAVVGGTQVNGVTTVTFTLSPVSPGLRNIIGSFGTTNTIQYHGPNKGVGSINILTSPAPTPAPTCPSCPTTSAPSTCAACATCATCPTSVSTTSAPSTCAACPTAAPCKSGSSALFSSLALFLFSVLFVMW